MNVSEIVKAIVESINNVKDGYTKFMLRALLTLVVLGIALFIGYSSYTLIVKEKHTKLGDSEFNIPDSNPVTNKTDKVKIDTSSKSSISASPIKKNIHSYKPKNEVVRQATTLKPVDTSKPKNSF